MVASVLRGPDVVSGYKCDPWTDVDQILDQHQDEVFRLSVGELSLSSGDENSGHGLEETSHSVPSELDRVILEGGTCSGTGSGQVADDPLQGCAGTPRILRPDNPGSLLFGPQAGLVKLSTVPTVGASAPPVPPQPPPPNVTSIANTAVTLQWQRAQSSNCTGTLSLLQPFSYLGSRFD